MFKKFFLSTFLLLSFIGLIYPTNKENTKPLDFCFSLEKLISRNSIKKRKNISDKFKLISKDIAKFGVNKSKGALINRMIDEYKISKNSLILNIFPNEIYCLGGYWIEVVTPGKFESIFLRKSKEAIKELNELKELKELKEFKELKQEVDILIKDFNSDYKTLKDELHNHFK